MAIEKKSSQRDATLVKILERLANQIQEHDNRLDEISKYQKELFESVEKSELRHISRQDLTDAALEKFSETMLRYRSDMLGMVHEQDVMTDSMGGLNKRQDMIAAAQEEIGMELVNLDKRFEQQEKTSHDHYEFAVKQSEEFSRELEAVSHNSTDLHADTVKQLDEVNSDVKQQISDTNRNLAKLHLETSKQIDEGYGDIRKNFSDSNQNTAKLVSATEKQLGGEHRDLKRAIEQLRMETKRRLLALDGIEASLQVLMVRTEPPVKKPFIVVRAFRGAKGFFRFKLPEFFKRIFMRGEK